MPLILVWLVSSIGVSLHCQSGKLKPCSVQFFTGVNKPARSHFFSKIDSPHFIFFYLSYLFEHFAAYLMAIRITFKSLSYNYKNPITRLTNRDFLIKVGSGGKMWENLVSLDGFSLNLRRQHVSWRHAT